MVLKEAYRYQNFLSQKLLEAQSLLNNKTFTTKSTEHHMINDAKRTENDRIIEVVPSVVYDFTPMQVIQFIADLVKEKEVISEAISDVKKKLPLDIDAAIANNRVKQNCIVYLNRLVCQKSSEALSNATAYTWDAEGKQTPFYYNKKTITEINYDRDVVRGLMKRYQRECDETSTLLDKIEVTTEVDVDQRYDINSSLEELILQ